MLWYYVAASTVGFGLIGGSEIALLTLAASIRYKWRRAWSVTFAALATFVPILAVLYLFFISLPDTLTELVAGFIILLLGINFLYRGITKRGKKGSEKEKIEVGIIGIYTTMLFEELELSAIVMSIGAVSKEYLSAIAGLMIGIAVPLAAIKLFKRVIERVPEWMLQTAVGAMMIIVASAIIFLHI